MNKVREMGPWAMGSLLCFCCFFLCIHGSAQANDPLIGLVDSSDLDSFTTTTGMAYVEVSGSSTQTITANLLREENVGSVTELLSSVNANVGIVNVNQASGNLNNQANLRVIVFSTDFSSAAADIQIERSTEMSRNNLSTVGGNRQDLIRGSLRGNLGVIGVNQAAGSLNYQTNTLVLAIGGLITLTDVELADVQSSNTLAQRDTGTRSDVIEASFAGTQGIVQVSQAAGDLNQLGNTIGLSFREINLR